MKIGIALAAMLYGAAPPGPAVKGLDGIYAETEALYVDLHKNPELSGVERRTAGIFAERLKAAGFQVTTGVGGTGVVAILENGSGPTVMLRTELDALPVEEKTGLPYASKATAIDNGETVSVMHACGHDVHIAAIVASATLLARAKATWRGRLMIVGQPAEETLTGARAMLADGLFKRFPKPDFAYGVHVTSRLPAGTVGYKKGIIQASADTVEVKIFGRGGHGSAPHTSIDPVVIAARTVVALQTIVSRENDPLDPAVVTVGSIHAGTRPNIIPDEATLLITVRALEPRVRKKLLAAIERVVKGEAAAAGAPREPTVKVTGGADASVNDSELADRLVPAVGRAIGPANVVEVPPALSAEDFSEYLRAGSRTFRFWVGASEPKAFEQAKKSGVSLPSNHSPQFAPEREPALRTAIVALTTGALELLGRAE